MKFVTRHPWITLALVVSVCCWAFGPIQVGYWIGSHARTVIVGLWRFAVALVTGVL